MVYWHVEQTDGPTAERALMKLDSTSKTWKFMAVALLMGAMVGCRSAPRNEMPEVEPVPPKGSASVIRALNKLNHDLDHGLHPSGEPLGSVVFAPGDVVEVKFFYTPQLNEVQTVRPDGRIALQLIGELEVHGKSPSELQGELLRLYEPYLNRPTISVLIRSLPNRRVFVGGQVNRPGIVEMPGKITVLEAVMESGGFDLREAEVRSVVVIRHDNALRYGYLLNLKPALVGDETTPFFLEPRDIVYVPRTKIAKVDQWVDQHINRLIPQTGFIFSRSVGRSTIGVDTSAR
jgi:protein involved in polysaccharide export with SLBB domain